MDFQSLFRRKGEGPALANASDNMSHSLKQKDVLVHEGELLDGQLPPPLAWSNVGGVISIKAHNLLGILEGRTRIRALVLQGLYPGLFEKAPQAGAEYDIPLQVVVSQLEDIFGRISLEQTAGEDLDTPFGQIAREDEARFKERQVDRREIRPTATPTLRNTDSGELRLKEEKCSGDEPSVQTMLHEEIEETDRACGPHGIRRVPVDDANRSGRSPSAIEEACSELEGRNAVSGTSRTSLRARKSQGDDSRHKGHVDLQELYLTDEPLEGSKVANLILQLPRVTGVIIVASHGGVVGGALSEGMNETLLSLAPGFVKQLLGFTQNMPGGPTKFVAFSVQSRQISLAIGRDVFLITEHEGKNLPPGLRERLVATAHALDKIYGV